MSDRYYSGGVPTISVEDAIEIAELCMLAGQPNRIADFLGSRLTPNEAKTRLAEAAAAPAPPAAAKPAASPSIFGGPTPEQRDALAAAIKKRFDAMAAKPPS
jgi:hypothetical protein